MPHIIEIVGTEMADKGRACDMHENGCGKGLVVGDILHFEKVVVRIVTNHAPPPCPFRKLKKAELVDKLT